MYTITIKPTTKPTIVKFEANKFLTKHESFEFNNIDEAGRSPLAQQLFHLPFVKTVYIAQNFVAIQKYNIVHWKDVQEEIAEQLKEFLNSGGTVITPSKEEEQKKVPVTVYAESTPNPAVMKFVSNKKLVLKSAEFKTVEETQHAPMARALFGLPFVKEVFFDENYISINKFNTAEWEDITLELREFIREYLEQRKEVLDEDAFIPKKKIDTPEKVVEVPVMDDISQQIVAILDEYVKPAVASDGGNILFKDYDETTKMVKVILQGACSGCPSSTITLKNGIENMLKEMMPGKVEKVEAING